ncbi:MAG: metal ABC transporter solute-binding protein, Zn/Mn family [Desulfonatronovibrionaceae bacterium]
MKKILRKKNCPQKHFPVLVPPIFLLLWMMFTVPALSAPVQVMVSIPPQEYFVRQIGGDQVQVESLLPPGASPHAYEPRPSKMADLGRSEIYAAIGVEYEKNLLPKIKSLYPDLDIVSTEKNIQLMPMKRKTGHSHDNHQHGHQGMDPHIWLSPALVMVQSSTILRALVEARPEKKLYFLENYQQFINEILELDLKIKNMFHDVKPGSRFMVFHPAWGYFARDYCLVQEPVEVEGKDPGAEDLKHLIDTAQAENIKTIFVSPQFSDKSARVIAQSIDGGTESIDPLALNWKDNLLKTAEKFRQALVHEN